MINKIFKKGQGAIEFIILFGAVMFFFIIIFGVIQQMNSEKNRDKNKLIFESVGLDVRDEINLAYESSEGYFREFIIPQNIIGYDYEINITESHVYIQIDNLRNAYKIVNVTGQLKKGLNNITKSNGKIYLNQ